VLRQIDRESVLPFVTPSGFVTMLSALRDLHISWLYEVT
jgi:hypothetical protein